MENKISCLGLGNKEWNALEWAMEYTIEMLNEHSDEDDPERLQVLATLEKIQADSLRAECDYARQNPLRLLYATYTKTLH